MASRSRAIGERGADVLNSRAKELHRLGLAFPAAAADVDAAHASGVAPSFSDDHHAAKRDQNPGC